jgi:hypothetical protein
MYIDYSNSYSDLSYAQRELILKLRRKTQKLVAHSDGSKVTFGLVPYNEKYGVVYTAINSRTAAKLVEKGYVVERPGYRYNTKFFIVK